MIALKESTKLMCPSELPRDGSQNKRFYRRPAPEEDADGDRAEAADYAFFCAVLCLEDSD